jgi:four helix bundle protein
MAKSLHDLAAFQRSLELVVEVYKVTKAFPRDERFGLTAQIRRAAIGVPSQIAEGHGRLHYGEWRQFLSQARGSLFEVETQAIIAVQLGFLPEAEHQRVEVLVRRTGKALVGLIKWVQERERSTSKPRNRVTPQPH